MAMRRSQHVVGLRTRFYCYNCRGYWRGLISRCCKPLLNQYFAQRACSFLARRGTWLHAVALRGERQGLVFVGIVACLILLAHSVASTRTSSRCYCCLYCCTLISGSGCQIPLIRPPDTWHLIHRCGRVGQPKHRVVLQRRAVVAVMIRVFGRCRRFPTITGLPASSVTTSSRAGQLLDTHQMLVATPDRRCGKAIGGCPTFTPRRIIAAETQLVGVRQSSIRFRISLSSIIVGFPQLPTRSSSRPWKSNSHWTLP